MIKKARKMKVDSKEFRVSPGKKVDLGKWPTIVEPYSKSKKQYKELLLEHMEKLSSLQQLHYASNHYALLVIFQGMDGAGKDSVIRHVMSGVNPRVARSTVSSSQALKNSNTIFSGAPRAGFQNAAGLASSIVPITRRCLSFECIRSFFAARGCPRNVA
jgi:hypothetical protein